MGDFVIRGGVILQSQRFCLAQQGFGLVFAVFIIGRGDDGLHGQRHGLHAGAQVGAALPGQPAVNLRLPFHIAAGGFQIPHAAVIFNRRAHDHHQVRNGAEHRAPHIGHGFLPAIHLA